MVLARKPWRRQSAGLRAQADRLRLAGSFAAAIPLYQRYLEMRPDHATAWMLYGHCLKECGDLAGADQAYAEAVKQGPRNRDAWVARAHFLKITGRRREAFAAFGRVLELGADPQSRWEHAALRSPGANPAADAGIGEARIWIDISDLLDFIGANRNPSGIQRVQLALVEHALAHPQALTCVLTNSWDPRVWSVSRGGLRELLALTERGGGGSKPMGALQDRLRDTLAETPLQPGVTLFQAGAFWIGNGNPPLHRAARLAGMRVTALIHDLIPLDMPEVCTYDNVRDFSAALSEALHSYDALLANSRHTAETMKRLNAAKGMPDRPVVAVPLAHGSPPADRTADVWPRAARRLRGRPFVLAVGTVEPRKNHVLLLRVWQRLLDEGSDPPPLVIVGKLGWLTGGFLEEMKRTRAVRGRVVHLPAASDLELETLYAHCLFTAFPSLTEGWGLPVGESLARGKLCIASDRGALPEVGGDFVSYVDAFDVEAALPVFRRMLLDPAWREERQRHLLEDFRPRSWAEVAADMIAALEAWPAPQPVDLPGPLMPMSVVYRPLPIATNGGATAVGLDPFHHPLRIMLAEGWTDPGLQGTAMAEGRAPLRLVAPEPGLLRLELRADRPLRLDIGEQSFAMRAHAQRVVELAVQKGPVEVVLQATPTVPITDDLPPGLWLTAVELRRVGA